MFCSQPLAARIERAERELVASACAIVQRRVADAFVAAIGGGLAAFTEPGSPLNKVVGLGFAPFDESAWPAIERELLQRGPVQIELATLAPPELGRFFTARGYVLVGVENVSGCLLERAAVVSSVAGIDVATCAAADLAAWVDIATTGFAAPDAQGVGAAEHYPRELVERVIRDFAAASGVTMFVAHREGVAAGAASLRLHDGIAQLAGAATLPAHRRRGVQAALLAHRCAFAARAGCDLAVVTTQPGSKSQQNMHRAGFALLYARCVLRRER